MLGFIVNVKVRVLWRVILLLRRSQLRVLLMSMTEGAISEKKKKRISFLLKEECFLLYSKSFFDILLCTT